MADPNFNDVELLLHFDGANGSTTFTDSSNRSQSVIPVGDAQLDTSIRKYGTAAGKFDGFGDHLRINTPSAALREWWAQKYVIEAFIYPSSLVGASYDDSGHKPTLFGNADPASTTNYWSFGPSTTSGFLTFYYFNGAAVIEQSASAPVTLGEWQHIAMCFDGTTVRLFHQGIEVRSFTIAGTPLSSDTVPMVLGQINNTAFQVHVDEWRIAAGPSADIYTGGFTPPTGPFPDENTDITALIETPGPLGIPQILATQAVSPRDAYVSAPSPLGASRLFGFNDFSALVTDTTQVYIMRVSGTPELEIPISSWQATLQVDRQDYLQCVVPNATPYADELATRIGTETFTVYRTGTAAGSVIESPMASAPLDTVVMNSGPLRETATLSGYNPEVTAPQSGTVSLTGVRQTFQSFGTGTGRVRADIDWVLRPGQTVEYGSLSLTADYINYFVPAAGDAYMDVGARG